MYNIKWIQAFRRFYNHTSGATAVEFALIALPLLLLLLGTIEVSRTFWTVTSLNEAAQIGARCIGLPEPACSNGANRARVAELNDYVIDIVRSRGILVDSTNIEIDINASICADIGQYVHVEIVKEIITVVGTFNIKGSACHVLQSLPGS